MATKKYGATGLMEWMCSIAVGGASFSFPFTGGMLNGYGMTPATYVTSNPVYQRIIEDSGYFRSGKIRLLSSSGAEAEPGRPGKAAEEPVPVEASTAEPAGGTVEYAEVKNSQQAKAVLMGQPYRVALPELSNKESILRKAKELGVAFPNWA